MECVCQDAAGGIDLVQREASQFVVIRHVPSSPTTNATIGKETWER